MNNKNWNRLVKGAKIGNRILDWCFILTMILALIYGGYGMYDTEMLFNAARVDKSMLAYKPKPVSKEEVKLSFEDLRAINEDVCAWLTIDGTNIDYPVVQGEDNSEYLNKTADLKPALSGAIFMDYQNSADFSDPYTLVYGHHMENDGMFGGIPRFFEDSYLKEHKTGTLMTPDGTIYELEIVACLETHAYDYTVYSNGNPTAERIQTLREKTGVENLFKNGQRVIAMSTCYDVISNGRAVLFAVIKE